MARATLSQGIVVAITDAVEEISEVVDVTDHSSGSNPFFEPRSGLSSLRGPGPVRRDG